MGTPLTTSLCRINMPNIKTKINNYLLIFYVFMNYERWPSFHGIARKCVKDLFSNFDSGRSLYKYIIYISIYIYIYISIYIYIYISLYIYIYIYI